MTVSANHVMRDVSARRWAAAAAAHDLEGPESHRPPRGCGAAVRLCCFGARVRPSDDRNAAEALRQGPARHAQSAPPRAAPAAPPPAQLPSPSPV
eukprot:365263-Chlamydomonas_euryale.AAC.14